MKKAKPRQEATRVTLVGMGLDLLLGIGKIVGGSFTNSFALITDGIHSLSDAVTDIFVLIVVRHSQSGPDAEHQYGHGRFETLGTITMGILFITTAGILLYDSSLRLRSGESIPTPAAAGIAIAILSIACKEWVYHYTMRVARRLNSSLLRANAWHSRTDAISSIAVLIGIVAARQGYVWMDTVAAVFVALIIARVGWDLCASALKELVDTAVPEQRRLQFESCILDITGILGITSLRSRVSGGRIILEARLLVNPRISVSEGHQLGETVNASLLGKFRDIAEVLIHIDPLPHASLTAYDENQHADHVLPAPAAVIENIKQHWRQFISDEDIESIDLHYLGSGIEIDLTLKNSNSSTQFLNDLETAIQPIGYISYLRVFGKLHETKFTQQLS